MVSCVSNGRLNGVVVAKRDVPISSREALIYLAAAW